MAPVVRSSRWVAVAAGATIILASCGSPSPPPSSSTAAIASVPPSPTSATPSPGSTEAPPPSLEPSPTPSAAPTPSPDPVARTWPFRTDWTVADALFRPDGGVIVMEIQPDPSYVRLVALDASGQLQSGWPWLAPAVEPVVGYPTVGAALASDGAVVVVVGTRAGGSSVHRLDRQGHEQPGYPIQVATNGFCHDPIVAASGTAYVSCDLADAPGGDTVRAITFALRPDGSSVAGWPVRTGPLAQDAQLAANGTLYLGTVTKGNTRLVALGPDGRIRAGWPRLVAGGASFTVGTAGRLWVTSRDFGPDAGQCGLPVRTRYSVLGRDGRTVRGWPISVSGWGSDPTIGSDGTTYVATQRGLMIAYSSTGKVKAGWPISIPIRPAACYGGSSPQLAGSGTVLIAGPKTRFGTGIPTGAVALATTSGPTVAGWPVRVGYELATQCPFCVPGPGPIIPPAIGSRRIYVGAYSADLPRVVVFDRAGRKPSAAQRRLATSGTWELAWIRIAPTGRVWTLIKGEEAGGILQPIAQDRLLTTP